MKKAFIITLLWCLSFQFAVAQTKYVSASKLRLRAQPTTKAKILDKLYRGEKVTIIKTLSDSDWVEVVTEYYQIGFVHSKYLAEELSTIYGSKPSNNIKKYYTSSSSGKNYYSLTSGNTYAKSGQQYTTSKKTYTTGGKRYNTNGKYTTSKKKRKKSSKRNYSNTSDGYKLKYQTYREYHRGPRGGCYYINSNGNKTYVDRDYCRR